MQNYLEGLVDSCQTNASNAARLAGMQPSTLTRAKNPTISTLSKLASGLRMKMNLSFTPIQDPYAIVDFESIYTNEPPAGDWLDYGAKVLSKATTAQLALLVSRHSRLADREGAVLVDSPSQWFEVADLTDAATNNLHWWMSGPAACWAAGLEGADEPSEFVVYSDRPEYVAQALQSSAGGNGKTWVLPSSPQINTTGQVLAPGQRWTNIGRATIDTICTSWGNDNLERISQWVGA